jgi:hypothetical protein
MVFTFEREAGNKTLVAEVFHTDSCWRVFLMGWKTLKSPLSRGGCPNGWKGGQAVIESNAKVELLLKDGSGES